MELPVENLPPSPSVAVSVPAVSAAKSPVPALKLWGIRRSIGLSIGAALSVVIGLIAAAFWYGGFPSVVKDDSVTTRTLFDLLKLVFAVVAGLGGVAALVVAYRRQRVAEHTNKLAEFAHELAHAADGRAEVTKALAEAADERAKIEVDRNGVRLFNERFAKASEQLGSEKAAVRLAGVYAMAGLADDWREGRQTCVEVLCAYLRMPYTPPPQGSIEVQSKGHAETSAVVAPEVRLAREEREVRHTVIRLVSRHLSVANEDPTSWQGLDFDFTSATFDGGDFSGVTFSGGNVSFREAVFCGPRVSFNGAAFVGGEVSFARAKFEAGQVIFSGAVFAAGEVSFGGAEFSGGEVFFSGAEFSGGKVSFRHAKVSGGALFLVQAPFSGGDVSFEYAKFSGGEVFFSASTFSGAGMSFVGAVFSGAAVYFSGADISGGKVSFLQAEFAGGKVYFGASVFSGGRVSFLAAVFSGGEVSFEQAVFKGADVYFTQAEFQGGTVSLSTSAVYSNPPQFDEWRAGYCPEGLYLPEP